VSFRLRASFFLLRSQKKETKEKATPLPLVSFGLSAAAGRLRNSRFQRSNSPRRFPFAAQAEGAAKGVGKPFKCHGCWLIEVKSTQSKKP
jgi:hypothetical protein